MAGYVRAEARTYLAAPSALGFSAACVLPRLAVGAWPTNLQLSFIINEPKWHTANLIRESEGSPQIPQLRCGMTKGRVSIWDRLRRSQVSKARPGAPFDVCRRSELGHQEIIHQCKWGMAKRICEPAKVKHYFKSRLQATLKSGQKRRGGSWVLSLCRLGMRSGVLR